MKTRQEIYDIVFTKYRLWLGHGYTEDKKNRLSNIYAVKNTERVYQDQFDKTKTPFTLSIRDIE